MFVDTGTVELYLVAADVVLLSVVANVSFVPAVVPGTIVALETFVLVAAFCDVVAWVVVVVFVDVCFSVVLLGITKITALL